ncbi:hypothetical protein AGMMS50239_39460 [Bacteroidia bacterium]|nr:hypothetical protein AGMMS50239_39460 [Bacteroidia bacterium]
MIHSKVKKVRYKFVTEEFHEVYNILIYTEIWMVSSYPVHTANKTDYQLVAKSTPNFTPKNVKLGVLFFISCL